MRFLMRGRLRSVFARTREVRAADTVRRAMEALYPRAEDKAEVTMARPARPTLGDVGIAALTTAVSVGSFLLHNPFALEIDRDLPVTDPDLIGALEVAVAGVALIWRRVDPGLVLAVCVASSLARYAAGYPLALVPHAVIVAIYTVADRWSFRRSASAGVAVAVILALGAEAFVEVPATDDMATVFVAVSAGCVAGRSTRLRRRHASLLDERQRELAAWALVHERANIAREMHDIVASNVGIISAHAQAALVAPGDDRETDVLVTIAGLARDTLQDTRRLVGAWHTGAQAGAPLASLDDLESLVHRVRDIGLTVGLRLHGPQVRLPAAIELIAYRIVQESLTNVIKHGPSASVAVDVTFGPQRLDIVVDDRNGRPAPPPVTPGFGLIGLRQRVESNGGALVAGPTPRGFRVGAWLPVPAGQAGP